MCRIPPRLCAHVPHACAHVPHACSQVPHPSPDLPPCATACAQVPHPSPALCPGAASLPRIHTRPQGSWVRLPRSALHWPKTTHKPHASQMPRFPPPPMLPQVAHVPDLALEDDRISKEPVGACRSIGVHRPHLKESLSEFARLTSKELLLLLSGGCAQHPRCLLKDPVRVCCRAKWGHSPPWSDRESESESGRAPRGCHAPAEVQGAIPQ